MEQITEQNQEILKRDMMIDALQESVADMERYLQTSDWRQLTSQAIQDFTAQGRLKLAELARLMRIANPLIYRGVEIQKLYLFAQGVEITAANEELNEVLQLFLDDEKNQNAFLPCDNLHLYPLFRVSFHP